MRVNFGPERLPGLAAVTGCRILYDLFTTRAKNFPTLQYRNLVRYHHVLGPPPPPTSSATSQMHYFLLSTALAACASTATSLSLPFHFSSLQALPLSNHTFPTLTASNTTTDGLLQDPWPKPPFNVEISRTSYESTWLIINEYIEAGPGSLKGEVTRDLSLLIDQFETYHPDHFVDNRRVVTSGVVAVRFPAVRVRGSQRMTGALAVELLSTAWGLEYARGVRGWKAATVKTVKRGGGETVLGFFSLCIGVGPGVARALERCSGSGSEGGWEGEEEGDESLSLV